MSPAKKIVSTSTPAPVPAAPTSGVQPAAPQEAAPANAVHGAAPAGLAALSDKELTALMKAIVAERKGRTEKAKATGLQVGQKVIIRDSKSKSVGKEAVVILARKTRAMVQLPNVLSPLYLKISDLEKVG